MTLHRAITNEEADFDLLSLANEKGKFGLQLGYEPETHLQRAFERGIDQEWFTLVDLSEVANAPLSGFMRVFRLTAAGRARLAELRSIFENGSGTASAGAAR